MHLSTCIQTVGKLLSDDKMHAAFKVMVLRRQEELVGPPRHSIIAITCPHDSPVIFITIEQL